MADVDIQRYLDDIESQHASKPKYMAHVTALLEKVDAVTRVVKDMSKAFNVREAVGAQLDVDGGIVGVDRRFPPVSIPGIPPMLDDDTFRKVILARIVQNQWDGTNERFKEMWDATVGGELDAIYRDNQDMSMDIHITGYTEPTMIEMILRGFIIPKPGGVGLNVELTDETIMEGDALAADWHFYADCAHVGVFNHIDKETEAEPPLYSNAMPSANAAKVGILNHLDQETEAEASTMFGSAAPFNSASLGILNHTDEQTEQSDSMLYGSCAPCNSARMQIMVA